MALHLRNRARTQANRASRRAREPINQRQRQNRHYKSRSHCAARSHKMNYSTEPHPPETSNLHQVPISSFEFHSISDPRSAINSRLQPLYNGCVERSPVPRKSSRPARSLLQNHPRSKIPGSWPGPNSIMLRRLYSSLEFAHTHAASSAPGSLVPEFK